MSERDAVQALSDDALEADPAVAEYIERLRLASLDVRRAEACMKNHSEDVETCPYMMFTPQNRWGDPDGWWGYVIVWVNQRGSAGGGEQVSVTEPTPLRMLRRLRSEVDEHGPA
jgi:hypothetical protein